MLTASHRGPAGRRYATHVRWWVVIAAALAMPIGCRKHDSGASRPDHDAGPVLPPAPADDPDPPPQQLPLGPSPVSVDTDVAGHLDLTGTGLPAISTDGRRIARIDRGFAAGDHRRLALRILDVNSGHTVHEVVVFDPTRDLHRGHEPAPETLADPLRRANSLVAGDGWMSMIVPESVLPDGWIRCRGGDQAFEVAGIAVTYDEPKLVLRRGDRALEDHDFADWVASPRDGCEARSYIADAAIDLTHGVLMLEIQYCGDCGVRPRVTTVRFATGR